MFEEEIVAVLVVVTPMTPTDVLSVKGLVGLLIGNISKAVGVMWTDVDVDLAVTAVGVTPSVGIVVAPGIMANAGTVPA